MSSQKIRATPTLTRPQHRQLNSLSLKCLIWYSITFTAAPEAADVTQPQLLDCQRKPPHFPLQSEKQKPCDGYRKA
jgi:hypothetical protein